MGSVHHHTSSKATLTHATLITGASAGLGLQFAKLSAADKNNLVLVARRTDKLQALAQQLSQQYNIQCFVIAADLENPQSAQEIFNQTTKLGLHIDCLINNAGFGYTESFAKADLQQDVGMIEVNITSLVRLTKLFLNPMLAEKRGRILNIASTAAFQPGPYMATYYASKAFVSSFSEALNYELQDSGVSVTVSCPGPTSTEFAGRSGLGNSKLFKMGAATAESVAQEAYTAMKAGKRRVVHGWRNALGATLAGWTPNTVLLSLVARLQNPTRNKH